jgi:hypothetical protein
LLTRQGWIEKEITKAICEFGRPQEEIQIPYDDYRLLINELRTNFRLVGTEGGFEALNVMGVKITPIKGLWHDEEDNDRLVEEYEQETTRNR